MTSFRLSAGAALSISLLLTGFLTANLPAQTSGSEQTPAPTPLVLTVGKSAVITSPLPIERIVVGFGEIAEGMSTGIREVLISGKAPGETTLVIWQQGGGKMFYEVTVRPNQYLLNSRLEGIRNEIRKELGGQDVNLTFENNTVFLRGRVKDLTSAQRAQAICSTLGKTINLLYVDVPPPEAQVLLKVRFATVDRSASTELGMNIVSTGAGNTLGGVSTQQFPPPQLEVKDGGPKVTVSDALNVFLLRPDLNLLATIKALQRKSLLEILAEPNVLALNGRPASFLAGGEFPFPTLQAGATAGAVTIRFREFGVRLNFLPVVTPRGTIRLQVAPEVSALDFAKGLVVQGFNVPGLIVRRVNTEIELNSGQSFVIGGLLDDRLTDTISKLPLLGDIPILGKVFQSRSRTKENTELLVIVTPELVRPIPEQQPLPQLQFPAPLNHPVPADSMATPGIETTGPVSVTPPESSIPVETLIRSQAEMPAPAGNGTEPSSPVNPPEPFGNTASPPSNASAK